MKPGQAVTWQTGPASSPQILTGHVIEANGTKALVQSNGSRYEVERGKLRPVYQAKKLRQTCQYPGCGKPCDRPAAIYCSHECWGKAREDKAEENVFVGLVEYKTAHNGLSPTIDQLKQLTSLDSNTVMRALDRLKSAGRIWYEGGMRHRGIGVKGGKWIYEERG